MTCHINSLSKDGVVSVEGAEIQAIYVEVGDLLGKCKSLARSIKIARPTRGFPIRERNLILLA